MTSWRRATPAGFVFSVKGPRYITHILRLKNVRKPLANFFASGVFNLREKLGPMLWQFPPSLRYDAKLFETFLALLPRDTSAGVEAREIAREPHARPLLPADRRRSGHCATRSRSATTVSRRPNSSRSCAGTRSRSWWPTPRESGRISRTSPATSCICACTATRSCTRAATPRRRLQVGTAHPTRGRAGVSHADARRRRRRAARRPRPRMSIATSTTTSRCARPSTPTVSCRKLAVARADIRSVSPRGGSAERPPGPAASAVSLAPA